MDDAKRTRLSTYVENNPAPYTLDDITCNDLNFDKIFDRINHTSSSLGEELLYSVLRQPKENASELDEFEKMVSKFSEDDALVDRTLLTLKKLSKLKKISVFDYLFHLNDINPLKKIVRYQGILLFALAIVIIFFNTVLGTVLAVAVYIYNTLTYFRLKKDIDGHIVCFKYLGNAVKAGKDLPFIDEKSFKNLGFLSKGNIWLGNISGYTANGGSGNPLDMFIDILKMGFWFDIIHFYHLIDQVRDHFDEIKDFLVKIGMIDVYVSVALLRKEEQYCVPKINFGQREKEDVFTITEGRHPLLDCTVPNDIETKESILLTGSNASGKSTFLRMVAVNAVLAQTIHTVFAQKYSAPCLRVISSMSISDSILEGNSYYMAEVKSIKRIIDLADTSPVPVVCFIDEVLKGTNTKERIAASYALLKYLNEKCIVFAATHDVELTTMLKEVFINKHFSENFNGNDISFSYKLLEGPANTQNAIKLLEINGFPSQITSLANDTCK